MKLFFSPGACSLSPHIVLHELAIEAEYQEVDVRAKTLKADGDFLEVNPKGTVPVLQLDDGRLLTEGVAIVQYLADLHPGAGLAPPMDNFERYRLVEWLNYVASEVHPTFGLMFSPYATDESRQRQRELLAHKFSYLDKSLGDRPFLMGESFTVADAYLGTMLVWTVPMHVDLSPWPTLKAYYQRVMARPAVRAALRDEGLIP